MVGAGEGAIIMKAKLIQENREKKSFVYRMQDIENPMWLSYYPDFDGYYLGIPNKQVKEINKHIAEIIDPKYKLDISDEYDASSTSVKIYEERKQLDAIGGDKFRVSDIVIKFSEYTFGKKVGLSKSVLELRASKMCSNYMVADDFFDDIPVDTVDSDAVSSDTANDNTMNSKHDGLPF